jgi:CubicO group peptidase (beta-lactamase class C family)
VTSFRRTIASQAPPFQQRNPPKQGQWRCHDGDAEQSQLYPSSAFAPGLFGTFPRSPADNSPRLRLRTCRSMKSSPALPFGSASSFGSLGAGGALGFADPETGVGYAYVTNRMGTRLAGDPRDVALRDALYSHIPAPSGAFGQLVA